MAFIEKKARETKLALVSPEEQLILYKKHLDVLNVI